MKQIVYRNIIPFLLLFVASIAAKAQNAGMIHDGQRLLYEISSVRFITHGCRESSFIENYYVGGSKQMNNKTYWQLNFYRDKYDSACGQIPDSCYYLSSYPSYRPYYQPYNQPYIPVQIGIREEEGRWLVDKGEYMSLISDTCWWKYVGDASFIPYEDTGDGELVLYDFNKQAGEIYGAAEGHDPIIVDAVDFIETDDGIVRRRQTLSNGLQIVEGIGCINSPGLLLFYLNPRQSMLDYAMLSTFFDGERIVYARKFEEMAEAAAYEYEQKSVLLDCPDDNHPHAIDLGLPSGLKWACCNIGAGSPQEEGSLFAWGETEEKDRYELENYRFHTTGLNFDFTDTKGILSGTQYDAALRIWGGEWHTPTVEEAEELIHYCSHEKVRNRISKGLKVTGPSGRSIFIPFSSDHSGRLWTGNIYPFNQHFANTLFYTDDPAKYIFIMYPYVGMPIRPVFGDVSAISDSSQTKISDKNTISPVFNSLGIKVADHSTALPDLPAGLYIVKGKKIIK